MRVFVLVALLVGVGAGCKKKNPEAASEPPIALPCNYVPGAVRTYRSETTTVKTPAGAEGPMVLTNDLHIEVLSYDGTTSVLGVRQTRPAIEGGDPQLVAMLETANDHIRWDELTVRYTTNHETHTHTVENLDELLAQIAEAIRVTLADLPPEVAAAMAPMLESLQSADKVFADVNDKASPMVDYACGAIELEPIDFAFELPNPFGGPPFQANGRRWAEEGESGVYVVHLETIIDPEAAKAAVRQIATQMLPDSPEMERIMNDMRLDMRTDLELLLPVATGWPTRWTAVNTVNVSLGAMVVGGSTSTQLVTLVSAPAP